MSVVHITHLVDMCVEGDDEFEEVASSFDARQEDVHALLKGASLIVDLLRVTLPRLSQLLSCLQQLVSVCDRVLST